MLKGHTFKKQTYPTEAHMRLINLLTNGVDGILNIGKKMEINWTYNSITINNGMAIVQGNIIEEDSSTTLDVDLTGDGYSTASLVLEIDLDKENTEEELKQVSYKILQGRHIDPELTKDNIVENKTGVYQFLLADFDLGITGLTGMRDRRTYIDLDAILSSIKGNVLFNDFVWLNKQYEEAENTNVSIYHLAYPEGFSKENTQIVQVLINTNSYYDWRVGGAGGNSANQAIGIEMDNNYIKVTGLRKLDNLKILLVKKSAIPEVQASEVS